MDVIRTENLTKTYLTGKVHLTALGGVSLTIARGEFTAIAGPSGSGKTTLLNIVSGLDSPTDGQVWLAGNRLDTIGGAALADFRRDHVGFIFQSYNLIPVLNVRENVEYVMLLQGVPTRERHARVAAILEELGLAGFERRFPAELSGGQQQRVAVARALVARPDIIFADEPTANLDSKTGASLIDAMENLNRKHGVTIVFSTHDQMVMGRARRLVTLRDGLIAGDES